ncbi:MAG: hypothetical protein CMM10_10655 [Rhodospirillaceae bacterium]|nr:hypothetical protein [Rhodospirillaceae bacterium]
MQKVYLSYHYIYGKNFGKMKNSGNSFAVKNGPIWSPVRANSVASQIVLQVRDALFAGQLHPGDSLGSEKDLAARFDVSRISVRDALRTLETMGIIEIRVGAAGGARIADGNIEYFSDALAVQFKLAGVTEHEILDAQLAVESAIVEHAAQNRTPEDLARLTEILEEAKGLLDDPAAFTETGQRFHLALAEASGNRALIAQFKALRHVVWSRNAPRTNRNIAGRAHEMHRKLFKLVEQKNGERARAAMNEHLGSIRKTSFPTGSKEKHK